ncbi:hypothetical protein DRQ33_06440 [bacterium]|nr:MAG: hypothetical protein DRQ33_06440 [bacterium]
MKRTIFVLVVIPLIIYAMDTLYIFPHRPSGNIPDIPIGTGCGGLEYFGDPRDSLWKIHGYYERNRIGEGVWNIPDTTTEDTLGKTWWELPDSGIWGIDNSLGVPYDKAINHIKDEGMSILHFPAASGRWGGYQGKTKWYWYEWQSLIGPTGGRYIWDSDSAKLDTTSREIILGGDTLILPPRMQEMGFRQFITICDSVGAIALVPYTRLQDTTLYPYNEDSVYYKNFIARDFRHFCEYLWGNPDSSVWANIRKEEGHPEPYSEIKYLEITHDIWSHWKAWNPDSADPMFPDTTTIWNDLTKERKCVYYLGRDYRVIIGVFRQCQQDNSIFTTDAIDNVKLGVHLQRIGKYYSIADSAYFVGDFPSQIMAMVGESLYVDSTVYFIQADTVIDTVISSDLSNFDHLVLYNYCMKNLGVMRDPWAKTMNLGLADVKISSGNTIRDTLDGFSCVEIDSTLFLKSDYCHSERGGDSAVFRPFATPHINYGKLAMEELDSVYNVLSDYNSAGDVDLPYGILEWGNYVAFFKSNFVEALSVADYLLKISEREQKPLYITDWIQHQVGYNPNYLPPSYTIDNFYVGDDTFRYIGNMTRLGYQTNMVNDTIVREIPSFVFEFFNKYYLGKEKIQSSHHNISQWNYPGLNSAKIGTLEVEVNYDCDTIDTLLLKYRASGIPYIDTNSSGCYPDTPIVVTDSSGACDGDSSSSVIVDDFDKNYFSFAASRDSDRNVYIIATNTNHGNIYDNFRDEDTFCMYFGDKFPIHYSDTQFCLTRL